MIRTRIRKQEEGSYLVLAAFVLVVLMLASALAVDVSRKYSLEQNCQDVADAAAMAGANLLPDAVRAQMACSTYVQSVASGLYQLDDSAVQIRVDTSTRSCTIGVIVAGTWDPVLMPSWLLGDEQYRVMRYAVAVMHWDTAATTFTGPDTFGNLPGGPWALFVGDTATASSSLGNSIHIIGEVHTNDAIALSTSPQNAIVGGTFEVAAGSSGGGGITPVVSLYEVPPKIDNSGFVFDVTLNEGSAADIAQYSVGVVNNRATWNNLLALNGQPVPNTKCFWDGTKFLLDCNSFVTPAAGATDQTAAWGRGIDVNVIGEVSVAFPNGNGGVLPPDNTSSPGNNQNYWIGSFQTTKKLTVTSNNSELRCVKSSIAVAGKDNPGMAFNVGTSFQPGTVGFDNGGNAFDIYGVLNTPGTLQWTGNMNNYSAGAEGTPGNYDISGNNGFIKGSVICGALSNSLGNNFKIYYDGVLAPVVPVLNPYLTFPPRFSTPTVWLAK